MKKWISALLVLATVASCNNDGKSNDATENTSINSGGVENVNGNIPDTTNTINIGDEEDTANKTDNTFQ